MAPKRKRNATGALMFAPADRKGEVIIGVDEVGRGPMMGPVTVCAVHLRAAEPEAKDSKKWHSAAQLRRRDELVRQWKIRHVHALAWRTAAQINEVNILRATLGAMVEAVLAVKRLLPDDNKSGVRVLVDGDCLPSDDEVARQAPDGELDGVVWQTVVHGDNTYQSIAAASMIAKQARDAAVVELALSADPDGRYDWAHNKGYGTATHLRAIVEHGVSPEHRIERFTRKWVALHAQYETLPDHERPAFLDQHAPATWTRKSDTKAKPPPPEDHETESHPDSESYSAGRDPPTEIDHEGARVGEDNNASGADCDTVAESKFEGSAKSGVKDEPSPGGKRRKLDGPDDLLQADHAPSAVINNASCRVKSESTVIRS